MDQIIYSTHAYGGVQSAGGIPAMCTCYVYVARRGRKYAYLRILRGKMEIAGRGVAWVGNPPSVEERRVPLDSLQRELCIIGRE